MLLALYYAQHQDEVNFDYESYVYNPPLMFGHTNLHHFFGERPVAKTAVYILKSSTNAGHELRAAAVYIVEKTVKIILQIEYPTFVIEKPTLEKLAADVNTLTSTNLFFNLTLSNGQGFGDRYLRTQRRLHPTDATPPRRSRLKNLHVDIEPLSASTNSLTDLSALHRIHHESSETFCSWIEKLKADPAYVSAIVSHVLSKFRHLKRDASMLHVHFKYFMKNDPRLSFNLAEIYRLMLDGIQAAAIAIDSTTPALPTDPHQKEFLAGNRLAVVVRKTLKSRKADYSRLVLDFTHTSNLHDAILRKTEMGITAPVIVALGTHPEVTFYICIDDDDILRVRGQFGDALQSFMEIVHLFNLEYDKQTVGITYFLEAVMGMKNQLTSGRQQLLDVLLPRQKILDSTHGPTSNDATENKISQSSNAEPSTSSDALQSDNDSLLQCFFSSQSTTPTSRKRPTHSSDYSGKKPRQTQHNSSTLLSAIQETVPLESRSATQTSTQDREPSPSIFD